MSDEKKLVKALQKANYYIDENLALVVTLAQKLKKPLLLEGPAGVGKTELAKVVAECFDMEFIRLQCYEGLDEGHALYEWNYQKQLLYLENKGSGDWQEVQKDLFSEEFLLPRPLLRSFLTEKTAVLLIDEIDKSDEAFESFLLEALSDFAVTIPEKGTIVAKNPPMVFLTSNAKRDFSDGLKRRCVHYYIDYPTKERELAIIQGKIPEINAALAEEVVDFVQNLRTKALKKKPSIAETIDWAKTLCLLGVNHLDEAKVKATYHFLLKYEEDLKLLL